MRALAFFAACSTVCACGLTIVGTAGPAGGGTDSPEAGDASGGPDAPRPPDDAPHVDLDGGPSPCGADFLALCDTFEREAVTTAFDWSLPGSGLPVIIDDATSVSPTRSLAVRLTGFSGPSGFVSRPLSPPSARKIRVAFAMLVDSAMAYSQVLSVQFPGGPKYLQVIASYGALEIAEQDFSAFPTYFDATDAGAAGEGWARYELRVDLDAAELVLLRGAETLATRALERNYGALGDLRVGITYTALGAPATIRYDDVGILAE
ncbi:MAG: hypothetical protein KF819_13175 [Labilithrix sp.]|nr:hypothetical protein [Labilithrix sp.]